MRELEPMASASAVSWPVVRLTAPLERMVRAADDDGVRKDLENAPHALLDRLDDVGAGVYHDRGAETGLVGENAALHAHLHGLGDARAHDAAGGGFDGKGPLEDGDEDGRNLGDVHANDDDRAYQVEDYHKGDELLGEGSYALKTADDDEADGEEKEDADGNLRDVEGVVDVADHAVDLAHVANAEGGQKAEDREEDR